MAQSTLPRRTFREQIRWESVIRPWLGRIVLAAIFFAIGLYIVAPLRAAQQADHLPSAYLALPAGVVSVANDDATGALLPVRFADTTAARGQGFAGVGEEAMENAYLFYVLSRTTTSRATYATENFRAPTDFAAIDESGVVTVVARAAVGGERVAIAEPHRWLLVAEAGALERLGVVEGSRLDPESIRKF